MNFGYSNGAIVAMLCLATSACSVAVDPDRVQCETNSDCSARGSAFAGSVCIESLCQPDPKWSCVGQPRPTATSSGPFQAPFLIQHLITQNPLTGVNATLCRKLDVTCDKILGGDILTDEAGKVSLAVTSGFDGYARFQSPEIAPALYFFNPPVISDLPQFSLSIGGPEVIALLALQAGVQQQPDRGVLLINARDCTGAPAAGVQLTSSEDDALAQSFYSVQGLPSDKATATDSSGYGGVLNAATGTITVTGTVAATGLELGRVTLLAQANTLTYGAVVPDGPR